MNTSKFQQLRNFNRLAQITGYKFLNSTQLSPRKFEASYQMNSLGEQVRFFVYFGDDGVTYKPTHVKSKWLKLN